MILPAQELRRIRPVTPFCERTVAHGMTYGVGPAGYDVRISQDMWLWPFWGRLASTVERFDIPNDVIAFAMDKSTWARRFVFAMNTVLEPGWRGHLTLELVRLLPWPIKIKAGTPIAQVVFQRLEEATECPYGGKYQDQNSGAQSARFDPI